jgi:gas vesicle protein
MSQESIASVVSGQDEQEGAAQIHRLFSYLAQNPQQYPEVRQFLIQNDQLDPEDLPEQMTPEQMATVAQNLAPYSGEPGIGDVLASKGRNGDTMMAHVNPQEMQLLQSVGGSGTINPATGQPEFFLKKLFKKVVKPLVGAALGFLVGGPVGAVVGASGGYMSDQASRAADSAQTQADQQFALQQEAEQRRLTEERAAAERMLGETRTFQDQQLQVQRDMQAQAERAAAEQIRVQQEAFAAQQAAATAEANRVREAEQRRQSNILQGQQEISSVFGQFNDDFFNNRAKSYMDFALPQLDTQYQDTLRNLTASLARSGNLNSSLRGETFAKAQREYDTQKLSLADRGQQFANDARGAIERARSELFSTNASLADPGSIRTLAEQRAQSAVPGQTFTPLANMLTDLASTVGTTSKPATSKAAQGVSLFGGSASSGAGRLVS